jgi:hypothetical protein
MLNATHMLNATPPVGQVMKAVDHPHCIKLYDVFEDREKCYLVQVTPSTAKPHPTLIRRLCWIPWELEPF